MSMSYVHAKIAVRQSYVRSVVAYRVTQTSFYVLSKTKPV